VVFHIESLSTGRRSNLMEFYNRRNRWQFIKEYFPEHLERQEHRIWYHFQKYLFRGRLQRTLMEYMAYKDFKEGKLGRTYRKFSQRATK
jgi:GT2 family glycosyltransferase